MKKSTVISIAAAVVLSAAAAALVAGELGSPVDELPTMEPVEEKTFDKALYAEFEAAKDRGDYIVMNRLYSENMALTGVAFPTDGSYDPTHGGKLYTYPFDVKISDEERMSGNLYVVLPEVELDALSVGDGDFVALDRRENGDPEMVVLDSYRAEDASVIEELCSLLLSHEAAHPTDWARSLDSMVEEWQIHNAAYVMDYRVDHSKDVNLNNADEGVDWLARAAKEALGT